MVGMTWESDKRRRGSGRTGKKGIEGREGPSSYNNEKVDAQSNQFVVMMFGECNAL